MLTLKEINEISFGKAGFGGYKPEDVDDFIDEVVVSFKQLSQEKDELKNKVEESEEKNEEMQKKLSILAEKVETYRHDEDGMKEALISAHRMAKTAMGDAERQGENIITDAQSQADQIVEDGRAKAEEIMSNARLQAQDMLEQANDEAIAKAQKYVDEAEEKRKELDYLKEQVSAFKATMLDLYKKHLEMINRIPAFKSKGQTSAKTPESRISGGAAGKPIDAAVGGAAVETAKDNIAAMPRSTMEETAVSARQAAPRTSRATRIDNPDPDLQASPDQEHESYVPRRSARPVAREASVEYGPSKTQSKTRLQPDIINTAETARSAGKKRYSLPENEDLTEMGIDTRRYSNIPDSLWKEKENDYSNLQFGSNLEDS